MKNRILLFFVIALILTASILFYSCDKTSTGSTVSFEYPGTYKGTFTYIEDWFTSEEETHLDTAVVVTFYSSYFKMEVVEETAHCCEIDSATFSFSNGILTTNIITQNSDRTQVCAPDHGPEGGFSYDVQDGYIVFTIQDIDNRVFKQLELQPVIVE